MSNTFKDKKASKLRKRIKENLEPVKTKKYLKHKRHGSCEEFENCPDCGGLTNLQNGFLVCTDCGWVDAGQTLFLDQVITHF
jgi:hypothetical protein